MLWNITIGVNKEITKMLKKDNLRYEEKKHVANMLDIEYEIPYQPRRC